MFEDTKKNIILIEKNRSHKDFFKTLFISHKGQELKTENWPIELSNNICSQQFMLFESQLNFTNPCLFDYQIELNSLPVGRIIFERQKEFYYINYIALLPDYQKKGIARHVFQLILNEATNKLLPVYLRVSLDNTSRFMYEKFGFETLKKDAIAQIMVYKLADISYKNNSINLKQIINP